MTAADPQASLLARIDVVAAHYELRSAAARVCAEDGDRDGFARWSALAATAEERLAAFTARLQQLRVRS